MPPERVRLHAQIAAAAAAKEAARLRPLLERIEGVMAISKGGTKHHADVLAEVIAEVRRELGRPEDGSC